MDSKQGSSELETPSTILMRTVHGNVFFDLRAESAPNTVTRFASLAKQGFYDGQIFYEVIPGQFIESGDPTSTGKGGSGKNMTIEDNDLKIKKGAIILMPNPTNPGLSDSRFRIILSDEVMDLEQLKGTVFAQANKGIELLDLIQKGDKILSISIE